MAIQIRNYKHLWLLTNPYIKIWSVQYQDYMKILYKEEVASNEHGEESKIQIEEWQVKKWNVEVVVFFYTNSDKQSCFTSERLVFNDVDESQLSYEWLYNLVKADARFADSENC